MIDGPSMCIRRTRGMVLHNYWFSPRTNKALLESLVLRNQEWEFLALSHINFVHIFLLELLEHETREFIHNLNQATTHTH